MATMPDATLEVRQGETQRGLCFWEWLALLFIYLRLTGEIQWSWWWVLSPLAVWPLGFFLRAMVRGFEKTVEEMCVPRF